MYGGGGGGAMNFSTSLGDLAVKRKRWEKALCRCKDVTMCN
jgi:hypothetical protein